ncbi:uncharacterized protein [Ranitomeya imitator]|uniref:uncharacterized protein n=1 Tax=Ranitomeya imitator TaxID=111125 RepID=UPI0037E765B1
MTRWRSNRDQYRRERQQRARRWSATPPKKQKYISYDRLSFLDPSMYLRPAQSILTDRETGSDSEAVIDPVSVEEVAGPSWTWKDGGRRGQSASASQETAASVEDAAPPPSAAPDPGSQEEHGHSSSSPTVPLVSSPQAAGALRRGRRRRELQASRRDVDAGVLNHFARVATDDGEEAFARSLARNLRPLPREVRLRVRGCIQMLIDLCTSPNDPYEALEFIERQLSPPNPLRVPRPQQVHGQSGFEAPPPRVPTPQPLPTQNQPRPAPYHMAAYNQPSQFWLVPTLVWTTWPYWGFPYGQYTTGQYEQGLYFETQHTASTQGEGRLAQQRPPELPPSPPPTYRNLWRIPCYHRWIRLLSLRTFGPRTAACRRSRCSR